MNIKRSIVQLVLAGAALFVLCGGALVQAFTGPAAVPPLKNASPALDTTTTPQTKDATGSSVFGTVPGVLLDIKGNTSAERLYAWENIVTSQDLTVKGLLVGQENWTSGLRPVCVYEDTSNPLNPNNHKLTICAPQCGNGFVEAGEQCDDGNATNGDGCSISCTL